MELCLCLDLYVLPAFSLLWEMWFYVKILKVRVISLTYDTFLLS